jgi:hypothetical protein
MNSSAIFLTKYFLINASILDLLGWIVQNMDDRMHRFS